MAIASQLSSDASWVYALAVYARPSVSPACLKLQSEAGVDVMMMLGLIWARASLKSPVVQSDIEAIDEACTPWRENVVRALRVIRTALKQGPAPAPTSETELLRNQIKSSELAAERLQNDLVTQLIQARLTHKMGSAPAGIAEIETLIAQVVDASVAGQSRLLTNEIAVIAGAAASVAAGHAA